MQLSRAELEQSLDLVACLYRGAIESEPHAPLDRLASLLRSYNAQTYTYDRRQGKVIEAAAVSGQQADIEEYARDWSHLDPRPAMHVNKPSGMVARCHQHFSDAFVARDPFYQEYFLPRLGLRWAMGGMVHSEDGTSTVVAVLRAPDQGRYEDTAEVVLSSLLPHFVQAAALRRKLQDQAPGLRSAWAVVEKLSSPCFVLGGSGQLLFSNAAAMALPPETPFRAACEQLRFQAPEDGTAWEAAWARFRSERLPTSMCLRSPLHAGWRLNLVPAPHLGVGADARDKSLCFVFAERVGSETASHARAFARLWRLSPAEAEVLLLMLEGLHTKVIARRRGASINTVRSQVAAILAKSGCTSQKEVVARALGGSGAI